MVIELHLHNFKSGYLLFLHLQKGDAPWKWYIYLSKFCGLRTIGVYCIWLLGIISTNKEVIFCPAPSGGRSPLEVIYRGMPFVYTYPSTLCHAVSEYIWLWGCTIKILIVVNCFFLHLQECDGLWKWDIHTSYISFCYWRCTDSRDILLLKIELIV